MRLNCLSAFGLVQLGAAFQPGNIDAKTSQIRTALATSPIETTDVRAELKEVLRREYQSFFRPFESEYYSQDVTFTDPLTRFTGPQRYENNVMMLSGRSFPGDLLFDNANIVLHSVEDVGERGMRTRWTLSMSFKALPWKPVAKFSGISEYEINDKGLICSQVDYWDSVNLEDGQYKAQSTIKGVQDFVDQLKPVSEAAKAVGAEVPFTLLRRAATYTVRRYPKLAVASAPYRQRPEGFALLGAYAGGENEESTKVEPLAPTLLRVPKEAAGDAGAGKTMLWPMSFLYPDGSQHRSKLPGPSGEVRLEDVDFDVVAVLRFTEAATEAAVRYYSRVLEEAVRADGLAPVAEAESGYLVAQYNAVFSLQTRRNEIWLPLKAHDWQ